MTRQQFRLIVQGRQHRWSSPGRHHRSSVLPLSDPDFRSPVFASPSASSAAFRRPLNTIAGVLPGVASRMLRVPQ